MLSGKQKTFPYHLSSFGILAIFVPEKLDASYCLPTKLGLAHDPDGGFDIRSKIG